MAGAKKLVMGASGFLGSHVTRQLVERGDHVRVILRRTSPTKAIDDLDVERHYGDIFDDDALRAAMAGCDDVFYCVFDTRAWLRDPAPLFHTNVEGPRHVLDAAVNADLRRFVFTSTIGTIGMPAERRPATEEDEFRRDSQLTSRSVRLMHIWPTLDHGKAERELGWQPTPVHDSIRRAAQFFRDNRPARKDR